MDYINDITVNRLKNVIAGDLEGISKEVNWQGGGSFVYCELAELASKYSDRIEQAKIQESLLLSGMTSKKARIFPIKLILKRLIKTYSHSMILLLKTKNAF